MKLLYKIIAFFVSLVAMMLVLPYLFTLFSAMTAMGMIFILLFVVFPIFSIAIGLLAATDIKKLFWMPIVEAAIFPVLFSIAMGSWAFETYAYSLIYILAAGLSAAIALFVKALRKWEEKI